MSGDSVVLDEDTAAQAEPDASSRVAALFVRMWAVAHVIHLTAATQGRLDTPWNIGAVVAALMLLKDPRRVWWLVAMAGFQVADYVAEMPLSPDHWAMILVINVAIVSTIAWKRSVSLASVGSAFPAARLLLFVAYGAAVVAKYNWSFLDPVKSCATSIASAASLGATNSIHLPWPLFGIGFETLIPIMLAVPVLRRHGVRVGLAFHFTLSMSPSFAVVDFTAALYALFLLFLPLDDVTRVLERLTRLGAWSSIVRDVRRFPWVAMAVLLALAGFSGYVFPTLASAVIYVFSEVYLLTFLVVGLLTWRVASRGTRPFGRLLWVHVPALVLALLWAANPYLGLRTAGAFTMFSSIRTEAPSPNHLFMPHLRVVDWQDEMVTVDSSSDPQLDSSKGLLAVPLAEIRRRAAADPDLTVTGRLDGRTVTWGPGAGQVPIEPLPAWLGKLMLFRPVPVTDAPFCGNG